SGRVALTLSLVQAGLSAVAVVCDRAGAGPVVVSSAIVLLGGLAAIAMLDTARWRRPGIAAAVTVPRPGTRSATAVSVPAHPAPSTLKVAAEAEHG
ncbi:MAG: hypothetical protein WAL22_04785, partial [Solirubrobacteraceae bacterium]